MPVSYGASVDAVEIAWVPGALKFLAADRMAASGSLRCGDRLGSGDSRATAHFDVAGGGQGVLAALKNLPVIFGVITVIPLNRRRAADQIGEQGMGAVTRH